MAPRSKASREPKATSETTSTKASTELTSRPRRTPKREKAQNSIETTEPAQEVSKAKSKNTEPVKRGSKRGRNQTKPVEEEPQPPPSKRAKSTSVDKKADSTKKTKPVTSKQKNTESDVKADAATQDSEYIGPNGVQYWLMKAEPDTRIVNGIDVSFSIDKLAAATAPEPWDGVRNYVARNNMRTMHVNDLAFFYHSNTTVPGIAGTMRIVREAETDMSAFDPKHPYFDEKSNPESPRWDCVQVQFESKFPRIVTLKELKGTLELSEMQIAMKAYGRLSVQKVRVKEWEFVLKMIEDGA